MILLQLLQTAHLTVSSQKAFGEASTYPHGEFPVSSEDQPVSLRDGRPPVYTAICFLTNLNYPPSSSSPSKAIKAHGSMLCSR